MGKQQNGSLSRHMVKSQHLFLTTVGLFCRILSIFSVVSKDQSLTETCTPSIWVHFPGRNLTFPTRSNFLVLETTTQLVLIPRRAKCLSSVVMFGATKLTTCGNSTCKRRNGCSWTKETIPKQEDKSISDPAQGEEHHWLSTKIHYICLEVMMIWMRNWMTSGNTT